MADSLDDFFAKKDRSKKSKGKKIILPVAPADLVDESDKYPDEDTTNIVPVKEPVINIYVKLGDEEDGEWKEFEEEKDYSGLKIQAMTIKDKEEEKERERQQEIQDQENKRSDGQSGPWKVASASENSDATSKNDISSSNAAVEAKKLAEDEQKAAAKEEKTEVKPAAYVPPSMRNRMAASSAGGGVTQLQPTRMSAVPRKVTAPAIESQQEFPSLGALSRNIR